MISSVLCRFFCTGTSKIYFHSGVLLNIAPDHRVSWSAYRILCFLFQILLMTLYSLPFQKVYPKYAFLKMGHSMGYIIFLNYTTLYKIGMDNRKQKTRLVKRVFILFYIAVVFVLAEDRGFIYCLLCIDISMFMNSIFYLGYILGYTFSFV